MLIGRQSAAKMSFIQKRGLSTLIPPKVRSHVCLLSGDMR
jgi:hypothetical protein